MLSFEPRFRMFTINGQSSSCQSYRPHLDYGDVVYDQHFNNSLHQKLESVQLNAPLAIRGAIRDSSREKLYQELGLESLKQRRWFRELYYFFKTAKNQSPNYLFYKTPITETAYRTRNKIDNIPRFNAKHTFFKNSFFPSTVIEWNNLDKGIRSSESFAIFKNSILQFTRPTPKSLLKTSHKFLRKYSKY